MGSRAHQTWWSVLTLVAAMGLLAGSWASAGGKPPKPPKPDDPPPPAGTVYFAFDWSVLHKMDADGGNKTALPTGLVARWDEPSHELHGGRRWWLCARPVEDAGVYPDGRPRFGLFAVPEDGDGPDVLLAHDPSLQPLCFPDQSMEGTYLFPRWTLGDSKVSWAACEWADDQVVDGGIYTVAITFDLDGTPSAAGNIAKVPVDIVFEGWPYSDTAALYLDGYDWSPDGAAVVLSGRLVSGQEGLIVVWDPEGPDPAIQKIADRTFCWPRWSPDGSKIAFQVIYTAYDGIYTINPDGSDRTTIVVPKTGESVNLPHWSPASSHLVYSHRTVHLRAFKATYDVYRVAANGDGVTNLTQDTKAECYPVAWRSSGDAVAAAAQTAAATLCPSDEPDPPSRGDEAPASAGEVGTDF